MKRTLLASALVIFLFAGGHYLNHRTTVHANPNDWARLEQYEQPNKKILPGMTIFFGDSITERWDLSSDKSFVNRGIATQVTAQMVARFRQDVVDLRPKTVVILAGTNDVRGIGYPFSIETTEGNIQSMVELAKLHGIRPVLCSVLPLGHHPIDSPRDPVEGVSILNHWLRTYSADQNIPFIDYFAAMEGPDGMKPSLTDDGVHPNKAGYAIMRRLVDSAVK